MILIRIVRRIILLPVLVWFWSTRRRKSKPNRTRPTKKGIVQFVFFNAGGAAFFVVGYATFALLYGLAHWPWLPAKIIGDGLGWSVNFAIQYFLAFREERGGQHPHVVAGKFTFLSLINLGIDYAIVAVLNWLGVTPFIGLIVASQFFTVWKWFWYKRWVFRPKAEHRSG